MCSTRPTSRTRRSRIAATRYPCHWTARPPRPCDRSLRADRITRAGWVIVDDFLHHLRDLAGAIEANPLRAPLVGFRDRPAGVAVPAFVHAQLVQLFRLILQPLGAIGVGLHAVVHHLVRPIPSA